VRGLTFLRRFEGKPGPGHGVVLTSSTFTQAADESGMSRRYGGIHFEDADIESRRLGRRVAVLAWDKTQEYIFGSGKVRPAPVRTSTKETDIAG